MFTLQQFENKLDLVSYWSDIKLTKNVFLKL